MKLEELRTKLGYQGLLLGGVALLTSAALAFASRATEPDIKAAEAADLKQSLAQVLPGGYDNDLLKDTVTLPGAEGDVLVYRARHAGKVDAVVYQVIAHGYSGAIVCVMGVSKEGKILGVRVIKHAETPGLGDKIETSKSNWILSFDGKWLGNPPADKWAVKKDGGVFDQFAGATITPRGVVKAIKGGMEFFAANKAQLLDDAGGKQ
jgi:H+/Na+-translocating ferredoxin:NAD+ oxidoreductase subunit G